MFENEIQNDENQGIFPLRRDRSRSEESLNVNRNLNISEKSKNLMEEYEKQMKMIKGKVNQITERRSYNLQINSIKKKAK